MAGEPEVVGGIVVPITADTSGLNKGLDEAGTAVKGHTEVWQQAGSVIAGIVGVGMLNAVKSYVTTSVREYTRLDLALDRTSRTLQKLGGTYAEAREKVEKYADTVEALTEFSDEEAARSINQIMLRTQDWSKSLQINALAMDIVARKGGDLGSTASMLTLAYQGNQRGLMQISRQLGIVGPAARDAGALFNRMEKDFKGAAASSANAYTEFKKLANEIGNLSEATGKALLPTAQSISVFVRAMLGSEEAKLMERIRSFQSVAANIRKNALYRDEATKARADAEATIWENRAKKAETDLARLRKTLPGQNGSLAKDAKNNQRNIEKDEEAAKRLEQANQRRADSAQAAATAEGEALQKLRAEQERLAAQLVGPVASGMESFFGKVLEGTASMEQAFEALGKAIAKSLLGALAMSLEQMAAVATTKGLAAIASIVGAAAAPGFFAEAAIEASGAGAIRAVAASLADGAVVHPTPGGSIVQVAEAGEAEVISPLGTLQSMINKAAGGTNNISLSFPNIKKSSDLDQGQVATVARRLLGELQRVKSRSGVSNA